MYVNPTYVHHHTGESSTDGDYGEANSNVQRAAWLDSAAKHTGPRSEGTMQQPQQSSRRAWLRDAGIVLALLMAALALGLTLGRADPTGCSCAAEVEAVSALRASEMQSLNATLAAMRAEVDRLGRALEAAEATTAMQLADVEDTATELCDALLESKGLSASMAVSQGIATNGAYDMEAFASDGVVYLAVANFIDGGSSSYNVMSRIYRHSNVSGQFELSQEIATSGAYDWEPFQLKGVTYLAVANHFNGTSYEVMSRIYRFSNTTSQFEQLQEVATSGATDWEAFVIEGTTYLAVANYWNDGKSRNIMSHIYRHSTTSGHFELMQEIPTIGAVDCEAFTLNGVVHLAVANYYDGSNYNLMSRIYRYSTVSGQFELMQEVPTSGACDWEAFTMDGVNYLAVANQLNTTNYNVDSRIYRYSLASDQFEVLQEIATSGAVNWEAFAIDGTTYLAVANHQSGETAQRVNSRIYRHSFKSGRFEVVQEVETVGALDWEALSLNGVTYLVVANFAIESRIYTFDVPC